MINSYALIQCSNAEQMEKLCNFEWSDAIGTHITLYDKHAVIHDYFTEHNFKDILTKLAVYLAQNCPDSNFTIHARIDDKERCYRTRFFLIYTNNSLVATHCTDNYIFANQHVCLDCGDDITGAPKLPEFHCPSCGVSYAMTGSDSAKDADYLFGLDEGTYIIPIPNIE